jgi:hypothetical protein
MAATAAQGEKVRRLHARTLLPCRGDTLRYGLIWQRLALAHADRVVSLAQRQLPPAASRTVVQKGARHRASALQCKQGSSRSLEGR